MTIFVSEKPSPAAAETPAGFKTTATADARISTSTTSTAATQDRADARGRLLPSARPTGHQLFYIFGMDGIGGMVISAGVNFAIAYVMYTTQDVSADPIRLFSLPNTLAGDAAVTIIIQSLLTWLIEFVLVHYDLSKRAVQPIGWIAQPSLPLTRWLLMLPPLPSKPESEGQNATAAPAETPEQSIPMMFAHNALRAMIIAAIPGFILLWPASVGILLTLGRKSGGDWVFGKKWIPQAFKAILGGLFGLMTTPLMAMYWLVKAGWESAERETTEVAVVEEV